MRTEMRRVTVFRMATFWERVAEVFFPALRRRRERRVSEEIRRLCSDDGIDDEVQFR